MDYAKVYGTMHENNPKHFPGYTSKRYKGKIADLVELHRPLRLIDYGCGKGYQYLGLRIHEAWGGLLPHCYDPAVRQLNVKPEGLFQGLICTDVLEHIEEKDLPGILADMLSFLEPENSFAFISVSCIPAKNKKLPDGRNVHVTIRPPEWWRNVFSVAKDNFKGNDLALQYACETDKDIIYGEV